MTTTSSQATTPSLLRCLHDVTTAEQALDRLAKRTTGEAQQQAADTVEQILSQVKDQGDRALIELTERFDRFRPEPLQVAPEQLVKAWKQTAADLRDALELAHRRIQDFHQRQKPQDLEIEGVHGERLGRRWRPVQRAGLYVPGGRAAYPSTVLMNAVPARAAGVERVVMVTPAGPDGQVNPTVLAAAHLAGVGNEANGVS